MSPKNKPKEEAKPKPLSKKELERLEHIKRLLIAPSLALEGKLYRVRRWGDPVMVDLGFDVNKVDTTNFQAVGLYNKETGFGAVTNFIRINRNDIDNLRNMQFDEVVDGKLYTQDIKLNWLCKHRGTIYMTDAKNDEWQTAPQIRWGTLALGGNLVQVAGFESLEIKLPGKRKARKHRMARLVGFRKSDWARPLHDLLAEGLVHRCYCAYKNNQFGDTPKGIVYSPFYSMADWDFGGTKKPTALYIPEEYLEPK